jgi:succinyl-CoA synthetase beta subunit
MIVDRAHRQPVVMASTEGGVEIEEVASDAREDPQASSSTRRRLLPFQARKVATRSASRPARRSQGVAEADLYRAATETRTPRCSRSTRSS